MFRQKFLALLLGMALLAPGAAFAQAPDLTAALQTFSDFALADLSTFDPATADQNFNGVLDDIEFAIIEASINGGNTTVGAALTANINQAATDLGTSGNSLLPSAKTVLGAYALLGTEDSWLVVQTVFAGSGAFGGNINPNRANYDETQGVVVGPCGDADSDGVGNKLEALNIGGTVQADEAAIVAAVFDNGITGAAADPGGCASKFVFSYRGFYNPSNQNVYFVAGFLGVLWPTANTYSNNFSINGLTIENAHLVTVDDADEAAFTATVLTGLDADAWASGNDLATEGDWKWHDGTSFWSGAAGGSAVGGAYTNWNSGEPNDSSGEDFLEIKPSGMWNDNDAENTELFLIEVEGPFADANSDGTPEAWLDNNNDGIPDGIGSTVVNVTVQGGGDPEVFPGNTLQLVSSSEPGDIYTYTSGDEGIATVGASSGLVTGVAPGTVTITSTVNAVSKGLGSTGSIQITVVEPEWFDVCGLDDAFTAQGAILASVGDDIGLPTDFGDFDIEAGVGDGIPDAWQFRMLAYVLCEGGYGLVKTGSPASAVAAYTANLAAVGTFATEMATGVAPWATALIDQQDEIAALATKFATTAAACDGLLAGSGVPSISGALGAIAAGISASEGDLEFLSDAALILVVIPDLLAGYYTMSSEGAASLDALLPVGDIQAAIAGLAPTHLVLGGIAAYLGGCPDGVAADAAAILGEIGASAPSLTTPAFATLVDDTKLANEPLSGAGDWNGDGLSNAGVAAAVIGAGGDADDYLAGATGDFGDFWPGNPALPVGGMVTLGALFSAMGAAGALVLRRKK